MSSESERARNAAAMLHPELLADHDDAATTRGGRRLDHAEGSSKPLRPPPEKQPRGAKIHGNRPIDQAEAAARFIAAPEHEKMHDERLWDLRQKRDREMHGIAEWEELRSLALAIKEHTLAHLDQYLEQFESAEERCPRALGSRRRRAQRDRPRHPERPWREVPDQEQVNADGGMRLSALHDVSRRRGH